MSSPITSEATIESILTAASLSRQILPFLVAQDHTLCALVDNAQQHVPLHTVGGVLKGHQLGPGRKVAGPGCQGSASHTFPKATFSYFLFFNGFAEGRSDAAQILSDQLAVSEEELVSDRIDVQKFFRHRRAGARQDRIWERMSKISL